MKDAHLEGITETWSQDVDSCGPANGICNTLLIETEDAGGGWYVVIKTERWALNDDAAIDAFAAALKATLTREPKEKP